MDLPFSHQKSIPVESLDEFLEKLRLDPLLDILGDGIVIIDGEKRVRFMNRSAQELLKLPESAAIGQACSEVVRSEVCDGACHQCLHQEGSSFMENFNVDFLTHTGDIIACCMHTTVLRDLKGRAVGYVEHFREMGQVRDIINQQSELLKLYANEKEKVQTLINSIGDGVFTLGQDGRIRSFSPRLEEMTGLREKELLGRAVGDIFYVASNNRSSVPLLSGQQIRKGSEIHDQSCEIISADGSPIPVLLNTIPLKDPDNSESIGVMGIVRDLRELESLKRELEDRYSFASIIGTGVRMQEIFELVERISDTNTSVLIEGESGTGKEMIARALHFRSPRKDNPFLKINCAALPDPLLESELFGYEKGAFTGASKKKPGKFKLADGGTIFLDEIGETSAAFQAKLLRVTQDLEFEPLGGTKTEKVDLRILAATNKDLKSEVVAGRFREDLYYRLCIVPIHLPPLRERKEDIPLLLEHSLEKVTKKYPDRKSRRPLFSPHSLSLMMDYEWPGNIRELENAVERAFVCSAAEVIEVSALPREIREAGFSLPAARGDEFPPVPYEQSKQVSELLDILRLCKGNKTQAAKILGISRTTLWRRLQDLEPGPGNTS